MSAVHLKTRDAFICGTRVGLSPQATGRIADATCRRCLNRFDGAVDAAHGDVLSARREARIVAALEATGLVDAYAYAADRSDSATRTLLTGILGSVAVGLAEMGYRADP